MTREFDVLVVGGGIAGASAAIAAARRGRRVALLRAAPGATSLVAGGWRGPLPVGLGEALEATELALRPSPAPLPHPTGALVRADLAPSAQLQAAPVEGAIVCGIAGLAGFHARTLAALWGDAAGVTLASATLRPDSPAPPAGWSPAALAAALDRDPGLLARALTDAVREHGARRAILPAVLGLERGEAVRSALADAAGVPVGEALGVPPSVPGWRLERAVSVALAAGGVEVVAGRAVGRETDGRRIRAVLARPAGGPDGARVRLAAEAVVLATGKYLAGGIRAKGAFEEPVLGCYVRVEARGLVHEVPDTLALTRRDRRAEHPLLLAGVWTDPDGRPLDRRGEVHYENVRVAGTVRAGVSADALGLGDAAAEGWAAGEAV